MKKLTIDLMWFRNASLWSYDCEGRNVFINLGPFAIHLSLILG
jgi:hypothetical protein